MAPRKGTKKRNTASPPAPPSPAVLDAASAIDTATATASSDALEVASSTDEGFATGPMSVEEVQTQIAKLEAQLDQLIQTSRTRGTRSQRRDRGALRTAAHAVAAVDELARPSADGDAIIDEARDFSSSDYYLRQWGRTAMRNRSEEVDEFGLDPKFAARWQPLFDFLYQRYFRVDTIGAAHIPSEGRCLVVANHSGAFPYDGAMLKTALYHAHPARRELRWLAEDFIFHLPFLGAFVNRLGAVRACQENAERLLRMDRLVGVFPEGVKGIGKLFRERYRLQRFGRGGFIRLCLRTGTPVVPCAVIGAEEAMPMLHRVEWLASVFGLPYLPVTPTFPALGPLGLWPAPTKWRIEFGEPIRFDGYGAEAAEDLLLVGRLAEKVRSIIQGMLDRGVAERHSIWFG